MFLDWPSQKRELSTELQRAIRRQTQMSAPVTAQVPRVILHEGDAMIVVRPDGARSKTELQSHEVSAKFARDELARGGGKQLVDAIHTLGSGLGEEMERTLLRKMSQLAEGSGAMFGGKTPQALRRSLLKALRSMDIDFDEEDKPSLIMVADPEAARRLQELETPELQEKIDSILEEKRDEWLRRETHRRLAD